MRIWIARTLWIGGAALAISLLAGLLSLVLMTLGDQSGAEAVRGVTLVTLAVFILDFTGLVVLLAVCELQRREPPDRNQ
ncbi:MAG: hypothetical protein JSS49_12330 [Planctomycetes bacterium]|nr:hypothetical protein [Planctomycetota bacterium]